MAESAIMAEMTEPGRERTCRRLGRNINGYFGETIEIGAFLREVESVAGGSGWERERFHEARGMPLLALRRGVGKPRRRLYISAGIHGDEPAGPLAALRLLREARWPEGVEVRLLPCLNPVGFVMNRRGNHDGIDLNREYLQPRAAEIVAHIEWLHRQPSFDLCLCLHEDWESHGFYLYELNPQRLPSMARAMIERVARVCPIDSSEIIEGRAASNGVICPNTDPFSRPDWPEAFFLHQHKTRLSYTLEAPSDFPLGVRVEALTEAVKAALELERQPV
jgi:hypothetical protein